VKHKVGGPEVVRPLTSAMNFVDANHAYFSSELSQIFHKQAFWRYEQHLDFLLLHCFNYLPF
jgi:hypothetical protein